MKLGFTLKAGAAALGAAALACGAPVAAEVTRSTDNGFVSRHEVIVKATPKEVWLALISPAGWWQSAHTWSGDAKNLTLTPQAGGCFCETIPEVNEPNRFTLQGSVEHMRVVQAYPELALRMVGSLGPLQSEPVTGVLTIAISKVDKGTRIVWEYNVGGPMRYEVPVISKAVDGVMGAQLGSLSKQLGVVAVPAFLPPAPAVQAPASAPVNGAGQGGASKPSATPASAPAAAPAPGRAVTPAPALTPVAKQPAAASAPTAAAPKPAPPAQPKPAPQPAPKVPSVADVFGDLKDSPKR